MIFKSDFVKGSDTWQKEGQADISSVSRIPGEKSIRIWRNNEEDDKLQTSWISPVIKTDGKAAVISFWAADNYLIQADFSYSASVSIEKCDGQGNPISTLTDIYLEWDNEQKTPDIWGKRFSDALKWKYYTYTVHKGIEQFKLKFYWPKQLVRGTCYLTDVLVTSADEKAEIQADKTTPVEVSPYKLLLSSPAPGNLFYKEDELRFDALIYAPDQKSINLPQNVVIKYQIKDFEKSLISEKSLPLIPLNPVKDELFYSSDPAKRRKITPDNNLIKRIVIDDETSKETGREFFINVSLVSNGKILAEDTIPYGVVEYFDYSGLDLSKSHFYTWPQGPNFYDSASKFQHDVREQDIFRKVRSVRNCFFEYGWREYQPEYPGPINVEKKLAGFPKRTYMPNIEQSNWGKFIPVGAQTGNEAFDPHLRQQLVGYNVDAYVKYIIEYIHVNVGAIDWVIPSGLERVITKRTAELQKKAYVAIKEKFPQIKIGFSVYGDDFENFKKYGLYDYTDFFTFHLYKTQFQWEEYKKLKTFYSQILKRPCPPFISTECARVSDSTQLNQVSSMLTGVWELLENGIIVMNYFNMCNRQPLSNPDIGNEITSPDGDDTAGYRFAQLIERPVMASEIVMAPDKEKFRWYDTSAVGAGLSIVPMLKTMAYYNILKDFDWTEFRKSLTLGKSTVYIFDTNNSTRCGMKTLSGFSPETLIIESDVPYVFKDMFGRTTEVTPINGKSIIQLPEYPATLIFDRKVPNLGFNLCSGGVMESRTYLGGDFDLKLDIPCLDMKGSMEAQLEVLGPNIIRSSCKIEEKDKRLGAQKKIKTPGNAEMGQFQMNVLLKNGGSVFGVLRNHLTISHPLNVVLTPCPISEGTTPGVKVELENFSDKMLSGKVVFHNKYLTEKMRPENLEKGFSLEANEKKTVFLEIAPELAAQNYNEKVDIELQLSTGEKIAKQTDLFFRSCPYTNKTIKIDGDLSDWPLDKLRPVEMERIKMRDGEVIPSADDAKSNARFYAMWKEDVLYMAVVVTDKTPQNRSMDVDMWKDDNVLFGIYPWRYSVGDVLNKGYYREHIGFLKDGSIGKFRLENVDGGPANMNDVQVAIKRTAEGYIYEFAYPAKTLFPLNMTSGNGFRLSLVVFDADEPRDDEDKRRFQGQLSFFGGANINWTANPKNWYEFIFTK